MPTYESEEITREKLEEIRKRSVCAICSEWLNMFLDMESHLAYVACHNYLDTHHEGVAKNYEYREENIPTRRKRMTAEIGDKKANKLVKYSATTQLTRPQAMEILEVIWPDAPALDKVAAAILCSSYGLNPLANHVFLIPFENWKTKEVTWARVWGIKAKRLLASRKGGYSYLDMTPRIMTEEEQIKVWGAVDKNNLCYITHLKDMKTSAEVYGYGKWPLKQKVWDKESKQHVEKENEPHGTDKGNSMANMASIRSESQALDRLRPAEMPSGWIATDEDYIEGEYKAVDTKTGEITEPQAEPETPPDAPELKTEAVKDKPSGNLSEDGIPRTKEELLSWLAVAKGWKSSVPGVSFLVNKCKITEERIEKDPAGVYEEVKSLL